MGNAAISYLTSQLGYQAPMLLVYLVAFVLALVFMGRASLPSMLTLCGVVVLVITTFAVAAMQAYMIQSRQDGGRGGADYAMMMNVVSIGGSCVRALGLSLLVAAIFVGRRSAIGSRAEIG